MTKYIYIYIKTLEINKRRKKHEKYRNTDAAADLCLCGGHDVYDRFGVVAVIVLPDVGDGGKG